MVIFTTGNLFDSNAQALVNTVNTVGVMGKGVALQFKQLFPNNFIAYQKACRAGQLQIGELLITEDTSLHTGRKLIINFPTKTDWRKPSAYEYTEAGLRRLAEEIKVRRLSSVALPPLGAGNGGLHWPKVKELIIQHLGALDCEVFVYEPSVEIAEKMRKERAKLTPARAMLLAVLYELVREGELVSEFAAEKVAYFLQRFGAAKHFKLQFKPKYYGPYSGKVRHVIHYLNGSYLSGYSDKNKGPFEPISLAMDTEPEVLAYLNQEGLAQERAIVERTKRYLDGFYSDFGLELLSTLDFIVEQNDGKCDLDTIRNALKTWSYRKSKSFDKEHMLKIGLKKIAELRQLLSS